MTKTDLLKDITAKFDSFDEKHLLRLNLNKNLNLFLEKNKSYPTLCMLLHTTDECLTEVHGAHFPFFHSLVTKCFLLIFTEFEHYEVIVQSVSELQEGPAVGIATCSLLKPTPTCKTTVDFFRLSADGESEFKLNV